MTSKRSSAGAIVIAVAVMVVLFFGSFMVGQYPIDPVGVVEIIGAQLFGFDCSQSDMAQTIVWKVRLPRICAALLVGAALSIAGAVYQGLFKNPMVSPDILGASSGAGFGAALAILLSLPYALIQVNAFAFEITYWLMGSLSTVNLQDILFLLPPLLVGIAPLAFLRWQLNAMAFGDEEAQAMGLNVKRLRGLFILCATLLTAASVAIAGMIGWIGLIIPHMARFIVGPNCKVLLPMSFLVGGSFLLLVDNVARNLFTVEIPLGILASIVGAPFFFYLLLKRKKEQL